MLRFISMCVPCFRASSNSDGDVATATVHAPSNTNGEQRTDMPDVDYERMHAVIDQIVADLVDRYLRSGMSTGRSTIFSGMERRFLETSIRHHVALGVALFLPYILPAIRGSMVCPLPQSATDTMLHQTINTSNASNASSQGHEDEHDSDNNECQLHHLAEQPFQVDEELVHGVDPVDSDVS